VRWDLALADTCGNKHICYADSVRAVQVVRLAFVATFVVAGLCNSGIAAEAVPGTEAVLCGRVSDQMDFGLRGVKLSLSNASGRTVMRFRSVSDGAYRFEASAGEGYTLTAELHGFRSIRLTGLTLAPGREHRLDVLLKVTNVDAVSEAEAPELLSRPLPVVESSWSGGRALKKFAYVREQDGAVSSLVEELSEAGTSFLRVRWARGLGNGLVIGRPASLFPMCGLPEAVGPHPLNLPRLGPKRPTGVEIRLRHNMQGLGGFAMQWLAGPWDSENIDLDSSRGVLLSQEGRWSVWRFSLSRPDHAPTDLAGFCIIPFPAEGLDDGVFEKFVSRNASAYIDLTEIRVVED
jgi:hypothetical protein